MKRNLLNFYKGKFTFIKGKFLFTDIQRKNHERNAKKKLKKIKKEKTSSKNKYFPH